MPLSALDELLSYAREEELRREKRETEKQLLPIWIVNYALAKLRGEEIMDYEAFIGEAFSTGRKEQAKPKAKRTAGEIMEEFAPLIEAERRRGRSNG